MDKFIVRATAIVANLYIVVVLIFALNGTDISTYDYLFSTTLLLGLVLTMLSHAQGKYHCKWMRGLCYNCIFTPLLNFFDSVLNLFNDAMTYIYAVASLVSLSIIYTIYMSVRHFHRVSKIKRQRNETGRTIK